MPLEEDILKELGDDIRLVARRANRFGQLIEEYSKGKYRGPYEANDFVYLRDGSYDGLYGGLQIPENLKNEARQILLKEKELGFAIFEMPGEEQINQDLQEYIEFFERCKNVEMELHKTLSDYKEKQSEVETQN